MYLKKKEYAGHVIFLETQFINFPGKRVSDMQRKFLKKLFCLAFSLSTWSFSVENMVNGRCYPCRDTYVEDKWKIVRAFFLSLVFLSSHFLEY